MKRFAAVLLAAAFSPGCGGGGGGNTAGGGGGGGGGGTCTISVSGDAASGVTAYSHPCGFHQSSASETASPPVAGVDNIFGTPNTYMLLDSTLLVMPKAILSVTQYGHDGFALPISLTEQDVVSTGFVLTAFTYDVSYTEWWAATPKQSAAGSPVGSFSLHLTSTTPATTADCAAYWVSFPISSCQFIHGTAHAVMVVDPNSIAIGNTAKGTVTIDWTF